MWQRFTERARSVILLGQEEASRMNSDHVGTEHLLLGLVRQNEGVAAQILQRMGVSLPKVRREIEREVQPESSVGSEPKLTPKAKRVLELAADEARRMKHNYIGTEHLLLALLREKDGLGATVLRRLGLDLEKARAEVMAYLGPDEPQINSNPPMKDVLTPETGVPLPPNAQVEMSLNQFVGNLNVGLAFPNNLKLVYGARIGYFGANAWAASWNRDREQRQIQIERLVIDLIEDDLAQATVSYSLGAALPHKAPLLQEVHARGWTEIVTFKRLVEDGENWWQIVPPDSFPLPNNGLEPALLAQAAFALAQNAPHDEAFDLAQRSLMQLKLLALSALQFTADWEESFAFAPRYLREALQPYQQNAQIFIVPETEEIYAFNEHLCAKKRDQIAHPAQTVLFYEGQKQELVFRYDGQAAVAFVDGHCVLVSPAQAQQLIWEP